MKILITIIALAGSLGLVLINTGCDSAQAAGFSSPPNGKSCVVQFRRDALGAAANLPISPTTGSINGAQTSVSGVLRATNDDWIVLDRGGQQIWIPKSVVLLIQVD